MTRRRRECTGPDQHRFSTAERVITAQPVSLKVATEIVERALRALAEPAAPVILEPPKRIRRAAPNDERTISLDLNAREAS
jgi:hypothetical protein